MPRYIATLLGVLLLIVRIDSSQTTMAQNTQPPIPTEWQTLAERTDYRETPRYDETAAKQAWTRTLEFFNKHLR